MSDWVLCGTCHRYHPADFACTMVRGATADEVAVFDAALMKSVTFIEDPEVIELRAKLTEAESRALLAVAREAELVKLLDHHHTAAVYLSGTTGPNYEGSELHQRTVAALSSTSPRAKRLLAIVEELQAELKWHESQPFQYRHDHRIAAIRAALTTQPVDEENSR